MDRQRMTQATENELVRAIMDIHETLVHADALDRIDSDLADGRAVPSPRGGKYRDEAMEIRSELWRRWSVTPEEADRRIEAAKRAVRMFGRTDEELRESYGPTSFNWVACGGPAMLAASIMSDAQHAIGEGRVKAATEAMVMEDVRLLLNRAKWVLFEGVRIERTAAEKAA